MVYPRASKDIHALSFETRGMLFTLILLKLVTKDGIYLTVNNRRMQTRLTEF